ncbi:xanthine dehydrogenase accessory protein XdhC [Afifella pfennigii]|uniref:xanthine dehydrogenase accessory protein XdhC n=1 Tax=Afifella pfennigii TaxID=209897 RepID=UPI00068E8CFE|nr:xanthine dehydrogenase accessory protein XdhC [Afifella pfennigii]
MSALAAFLRTKLAAGEPAIFVKVAEAKGSTPREAGAAMLVTEGDFAGTIGGGTLEYEALDRARRLLSEGRKHAEERVPLGPDLGQCCGGRVGLSFRAADKALLAELQAAEEAEAAAMPAVFLFGAGHVGRALALALMPLPFRLTVVDPRQEMLAGLPQGVETVWTALAEAVVAEAPPGSAHVIATHSHALDFAIAHAALKRGDAAYTGMIGSQTKRRQFERWACREGLDRATLARLVLPIGGTALRDKRPPVIAALVAAEVTTHLLQWQAAEAASGQEARRSDGTGRAPAAAGA